MKRAAIWSELAVELGQLRAQLERHAVRYRSQREKHLARVEGVDLSARVVCGVLRGKSSRFSARRFMQAFRGAAK